MAKRALCIGINDYPGNNNDLRGCVNDVVEWAKVLKARGFQVQTLIDKKATKAAMVKGINDLIRGSEPGDVAVLQFSGHGSWVPDTDGDEEDLRDEVLCPCDIGANSFLSDDELHVLFSRKRQDVRLVFLSDSCHSGTVSRVAPAIGVQAKPPMVKFLPPEEFLPASKLRIARHVARSRPAGPKPHQALLISGCEDVQTSADAYLGGRFHGAFTFYALRALKTLPAKATYRDWHRAIRKLLPNTTFDQRPALYGSEAQKNWPVLA